jgi:hypothetical protein
VTVYTLLSNDYVRFDARVTVCLSANAHDQYRLSVNRLPTTQPRVRSPRRSTTSRGLSTEPFTVRLHPRQGRRESDTPDQEDDDAVTASFDIHETLSTIIRSIQRSHNDTIRLILTNYNKIYIIVTGNGICRVTPINIYCHPVDLIQNNIITTI